MKQREKKQRHQKYPKMQVSEVYDTVRQKLFTCAQKLTGSQLHLPHRTKKNTKSNEEE